MNLRKVLRGSHFHKPPVRLDHGRMYMCVTVGLWITSLSLILVGPVPNSTISNLNVFTQMSMAVVMFLGSTAKIIGFLRGTRFLRPDADIRDSYLIAMWAILATNTGLSVYVIAIFMNYGNFLLSTMGGSLGLSMVIGALWNAWDFRSEIHRINAEFNDRYLS
jgi:hypothetical protein